MEAGSLVESSRSLGEFVVAADGAIDEGSSVIGDMEAVGEPDWSVVISGTASQKLALRMLEAPKTAERKEKVLDENERSEKKREKAATY